MTPASSNSEETHNTLKFAHRSKRVEIKASQNKASFVLSSGNSCWRLEDYSNGNDRLNIGVYSIL